MQPEKYLGICLADTGKNDVTGAEPGINSRPDLSAAHGVSTEPSLADPLQNRRIDIGFHGIMHMIAISPDRFLYLVERQPQQFHIVIIERCRCLEQPVDRKYSFHLKSFLFTLFEKTLTEEIESTHLVRSLDQK